MARRKRVSQTFEPTKEQRHIVKNLKAYLGRTDEEIAKVLGVSCDTLTRHFPEELKAGRDAANANMARALYENGISGNVAAQIFWMKTRAGWKEVDEQPKQSGTTVFNYFGSEKPDRYNKGDKDGTTDA